MRETFRPDKIRLLMVGESPPKTDFFYDCESRMKTLSAKTAEVLEEVYGENYGKGKDRKLLFLRSYESKGFYLHDFYDLRGKKVRRRRRDDIYEGIDELSSLMEDNEGSIRFVVTVFPKISDIVDEALEKTGVDAHHKIVPFPSNVSAQIYKQRMAEIIRKLESLPSSLGHDA